MLRRQQEVVTQRSVGIHSLPYDDDIDGMKLAIHEEHNLFPEFVEYHSNQLSQI